MTREHQPCGACARFLVAASRKKGEEGPGHCEGFDRTAHSTDAPCVLFNERGAWETRLAEQPSNPARHQRPQRPQPRARTTEPQP